MTEEAKLITSELNVFFDEQGTICMGGGLHYKLIIPGTPTVETIHSAVQRVHEWAEKYANKVIETAQDEPEKPFKEKVEDDGGRPPGGATDAQCKAILAICHRLDSEVAEKEMTKYGGAEWRLDKDGHLIPEWDFLKSLSKQQASNVIERLGRAAS